MVKSLKWLKLLPGNHYSIAHIAKTPVNVEIDRGFVFGELREDFSTLCGKATMPGVLAIAEGVTRVPHIVKPLRGGDLHLEVETPGNRALQPSGYFNRFTPY
jgi:hypothetical protein